MNHKWIKTPEPTVPAPPSESSANAGCPQTDAPTASGPAVSAAPGAVPTFSLSLQPADYAAKGWHLEASVQPEEVVLAAEQMDRDGYSLDTITGVDWLAQGQMEVVYDYFHFSQPSRVVVRTRIPRENPQLATISKVFPGANWHERETHDFFGIQFVGHPNLTPFLLPEDANYHPLRKDFKS